MICPILLTADTAYAIVVTVLWLTLRGHVVRVSDILMGGV